MSVSVAALLVTVPHGPASAHVYRPPSPLCVAKDRMGSVAPPIGLPSFFHWYPLTAPLPATVNVATAPTGTLALFQGNTLLEEVELPETQSHSELFLGALDSLLAARGLTLEKIDRYLTTSGPGS